MRVLYSAFQSRNDGSSVHSKELAHALRKLGVEVVHVPVFRFGKGDQADATRPESLERLTSASGLGRLVPRLAKELVFPLINLRKLARQVAKTEEVISGLAPDILLLRTDYSSISSYWLSVLATRRKARQNRIPLVLEVNAPLVHEYRTYFQEPRFSFWDYPVMASIFEKRIWRDSDAIVCVSNQLRELLVKNGV